MSKKRPLVLILAGYLAAGPSVLPAEASCGLEVCGMPDVAPSAGDREFSFWTGARFVNFDLGPRDGHYTEIPFHLMVPAPSPWRGGAQTSLVFLDDGTENNSGLTNLLLFAERRLGENNGASISAGGQLEVPVGDDEDGIASDHWELIPYAAVRQPTAVLPWSALAGFRFSLEDGHGHGRGRGTPLFVNPHEDKEFLYRFSVFPARRMGEFAPEIFVDGQHALDGPSDGTGFLSLGGKALADFGGWRLGPTAEIAVTKPRRFDYKLGVAAGATF